MEYRVLSNGLKMPMVGFGTYRIKDENPVKDVVKQAYEAGYRSFDAASYYGNEAQLGEAFSALGIWEDILLTTKVWNDIKGYDGVLEDFARSEARLGRVDIYMLHWPSDAFIERWRALESLYEEGRVRAIGVSNFKKHHLEELLAAAKHKPMLNQIEAHAYFLDEETIQYAREQEVLTQAWRPLMRTGPLLENETLPVIAKKYGKTVAQVCLKYLLMQGIAVLPKTVRQTRMVENIQLFDFELSDEDMAYMQTLNIGMRTGADPDVFI